MQAWIAERATAVAKLLRRVGPYVVMELILPGGTLFALLLYLHRSGQLRALMARPPIASFMRAASGTFDAFAFALQPAGSALTTAREDGLELALLAAR